MSDTVPGGREDQADLFVSTEICGSVNLVPMQVDVKDAPALFPDLLRLAEQGESVIITRGGLMVAELVAKRPVLRFSEESPAVKGETWLEPLNDSEKEEWFRAVDDESLCGEI